MNFSVVKRILWFLALLMPAFSCFSYDQAPFLITSEKSDNDKCVIPAYFYQKGDFPLFLSNEHGANKSQIIAGVPLRKGRGVKKFNDKADWYTAEITLKVAQAFERLTGKKPYVLIAKIHRSQIDFNRSAKLSYEHPILKSCYDDFHRVARTIIKEIKQRWKQGYLLDIHGQNKFPDNLIRGTFNGLTVTKLRQREGDNVYQKEQGLFGQLAGLGYKVTPEFPQKERFYRGGFMVKNYGSHRPDGINAIQLEIGKHYRKDPSVRKKLIADIAATLQQRMSVLIKGIEK